jgi:hypothetical protein
VTRTSIAFLVLGLLVGGFVAYVAISPSRQTSTTTEVSRTTTTVFSTLTGQTTTLTTTSYSTITTTVFTSAMAGQIVVLGASISHSLSGTAITLYCLSSPNSTSFVEVLNNGTTAIDISFLALRFGNNIYTASFGHGFCTVAAGTTLYLVLRTIPTGATQGEAYFVIVGYGSLQSASFSNTFY